ncbi:MAG TPA: hypothetical protein VG406_00180 [Isosphaeraceae bacterium]|jgi:hypothetical protein|nr:hypothetical protein [Isosphaeraceae bacterium]
MRLPWAPLAFALRASCACSELNPPVGTIAPGEAQNVRVGVRYAAYGEEKTILITVQSNDPLRSESTYHVFARCPEPLIVEPKQIAFDSVRPGTSLEAPLEMKMPDGRPLRESEFPGLESTNPYITLGRVRNAGGKTIVSVRLSPQAPVGSVSGVIRLKCAGDEATMAVPVSAYVQGEIKVAPAILSIGPSDLDRAKTLLVWRPDGKPLGTLDKVEAPAGLVVEEVGREPERHRRFSVRVSNCEKLADDGEIRLMFRNQAAPAVVRVSRSSGR